MGSGNVIGHRLKRFLNEIYRVIEIIDCVNTTAMEQKTVPDILTKL